MLESRSSKSRDEFAQTLLLPLDQERVRKSSNGNGLTSRNGHVPPRPSVRQSSRKLRGAYYTPTPVSTFLANWSILDPTARVLEPSAGDGEFLAAALERIGSDGKITAIELDDEEATKAAARGGTCTTVIKRDFFEWFQDCRPDGLFDAVLGNPPFIRYQDFREDHRQRAFELMREEGLRPTRLTNAWLPFVVVATKALRIGGRLALVLPAELLQVGYASELREYLVRKYAELTILTFRRLLFDGIQQETLLLLGVRGHGVSAEISFVELAGTEDLDAARLTRVDRAPVELNHAREKWTRYYLSPLELGLVRELETSETFCTLGDLAEIDVGIVTGQNDFFVLSQEQATERGLLPWCIPLVGRSAHIPGLVLERPDWVRLAFEGARCLLVQLGDTRRDSLEAPARAYVEYGESLGIHEGYKCAIRLPQWWKVPSLWAPDAFFLRQIHDGPRVIQNLAGATCTDTIYRVRTREGVDAAWLAAASVNSLLFAFAEIRGRSYGGGVLEIEPTEAEGLPFPRPSGGAQSLPLAELDRLIRTGEMETALDEADRLYLLSAGLSHSDVRTLRGIWKKLYERRLHRKRRQ